MNSKKVKELDDILQKIQSATGLSIGEISLKAQRNKGYIAQLKSRAKAGEQLIELIKDFENNS